MDDPRSEDTTAPARIAPPGGSPAHRLKRGTLLALVGAVAAVVAAPLTASAANTSVAQWHLDDTGSTMTDSSGHGHLGTLHGLRTGQPGWLGTAFSATKKPAYVSVPSAADLNPGSGAFSITVHVRFPSKPSSSVGDFDLLRKGLSTTTGGSYKVEISPSGKALCNFRGQSAQVELTKGPVLADNLWHTITCARTPNSVTLTVDGTAFTSAKKTGQLANSAALLIAAKDTSGHDQFTGLIDEITLTAG